MIQDLDDNSLKMYAEKSEFREYLVAKKKRKMEPASVSKSEIYDLQNIDFSLYNDRGLLDQIQCGVCSSITAKVSNLECDHFFCNDCINRISLSSHGKICPICRKSFSMEKLKPCRQVFKSF